MTDRQGQAPGGPTHRSGSPERPDQISRHKLVAALEKMLDGSDPAQVIADNEAARGFQVVRPGNATWFPTADWHSGSVASINGMTIRLVLLHARRPGTGAFTRMIADIRALHMLPVVIDPARDFAESLAKRGWVWRQEGTTFEDREIVWRPTK